MKCMNQLKEHCVEKKSAYFTKRELMQVTGLAEKDARAFIATWVKKNFVEHTKGTRWYRFRSHIMHQGVLADHANDYLRARMREEGFASKIFQSTHLGVPADKIARVMTK
jgi:DNA-binding IclR family transcriptional regulator